MNSSNVGKGVNYELTMKVKKHVFLFYMRLVTCLIFVSMLFIAANTRAQKINLDLHRVNLKKALLQVAKQSGYTFVYDSKGLKMNELVSVKVQNMDVASALELLLADLNVDFQIKGKSISLIPKSTPTGVAATRVEAPLIVQQLVRGRVTNPDGAPLVGASVTVQGTTLGALTDSNGYFVLEGAKDNDSLLISFLGFTTQTVESRANVGTIVLQQQDNVLDEATVRVNTGYQSLPKDRVTGAFSYISGEQLESKLATGLRNALEGQAAGVVIDKSGNIEIRGISTFNAQKSPLIVVDGYPVETSLDDINPLNISSITVLKDGVAASIYGSRAANGVIVVTTKFGQSGKPRVSYSGFANIIPRPDLKYLHRASASDYIDAEIDLFNENPNSPSTLSTGNRSRVTHLLVQVRENLISEEEAMAEINALRKIDGMSQIEEAFFRKEITYQHNLGISGGNEEHNYNIAVNYQQNQENIINNNNRRLILDLKNEWRPFSFLTAGASANFNIGNAETTYMQDGASVSGIHFSTLTEYSGTSLLRPYTDLWNADGSPASLWGLSQYKINTYGNTPGMKDWSYNPLIDINANEYTRKTFTARLSGFVRAQLIDGLSAEFGGNWVRGNALTRGLQGADAYKVRIAYNDATSKANNANHYFPDGAVVNENRDVNEAWTIRSQINYSKDFQGVKHRVNALIGNEIRQITFDNNQLATRLGFNPVAGSFIPVNIKDYTGGIYSSDMLFPSTFWDITDGQYRFGDNRFVSWYANASYEYDNRFILSGSTRLDLTNFFGTDKKYRYKPLWSIGGTYKLSNEQFWASSTLNKLHIRGSYGINGNISLNNGPFLILSAGSYSQTTGGVSYGVSAPPNNQLRWEKTKISNIGLDFGLFNSRVDGSLDYYNKYSEDLLTNDAIDPTMGYTSLFRNVGEMSNSGFELSMHIRAIDRDQWRWIISPNVAYNFNKVRNYNVVRQYTSNYTNPQGILATGYPAASIWGYRFAGLNDKGESQVYNAKDEVILMGNVGIDDLVYQGTFRPKWDLALTNRVKYQDWNLSFMFIAKLGHKYRKDAFSGSNYQNRYVGQRWKKPGDEHTTIYPVLKAWNMDLFDFPYIDALVGNASYAKLRDVTLSYDLSRWSKSLHIANAQVYVQGRNLFRIVAKGVDIDPETAEVNMSIGTGAFTEQGYTSLPLPRELFIGLKVGF